MFSDRMGVLFRSKEILQKEGLLLFIKRAFLFSVRSLVGFLFKYGNYYIYEKTLNKTTEFGFTTEIQNVTLTTISTIEEFDKLIAEGYDFKMMNFERNIEMGALPFCAFVGQELAHVTWIAPNEKAKKCIDYLPFKVNFQAGEVCSGASFTNPKYRGRGLLSYVYSSIFLYLFKEGVLKDKFTINKKNISSQKAHAKFDPVIIGEGCYLKILWWEFWKEKTIKEVKQ